MRTHFPLFQSHLDLAQTYWARLLKTSDLAVDATCGNGKDTLKLAHSLIPLNGQVVAFDIQEAAISSTQRLLENELAKEELERVKLIQASHEDFSPYLANHSARLVVYNLGYLPGSDKSKTTKTETSLRSVQSAQGLLIPGGLISITCYPGHEEGGNEERALLEWSKELDPKEWSCCYHKWVNRRQSPSLLLIQRRDGRPHD